MNDMIAKAVVEATRATIQTMVELHQGQEDQRSKVGGLALKQPQFNWDMADKYTEWTAFILEVRNVIPTYNAHEQEKMVMVKNWLGRKGLHYIESLTDVANQACGTLQELIETLTKNLGLNTMRQSNPYNSDNNVDMMGKMVRNRWGSYELWWWNTTIKS